MSVPVIYVLYTIPNWHTKNCFFTIPISITVGDPFEKYMMIKQSVCSIQIYSRFSFQFSKVVLTVFNWIYFQRLECLHICLLIFHSWLLFFLVGRLLLLIFFMQRCNCNYTKKQSTTNNNQPNRKYFFLNIASQHNWKSFKINWNNWQKRFFILFKTYCWWRTLLVDWFAQFWWKYTNGFMAK